MNALDYRRVYRAHVEAQGGSCELTVFVEAASHEQAIRKISAAIEAAWPWRRCVNESIYNIKSAADCIDEGESGARESRVFSPALRPGPFRGPRWKRAPDLRASSKNQAFAAPDCRLGIALQ